MTAKRFTMVYGKYIDNENNIEYDEKWESWKICELLNELHELAEGNENQLLKVMTYLHDNHYEIWEKVNKECFE